MPPTRIPINRVAIEERDGSGLLKAFPLDNGVEGDLCDGVGWEVRVVVKGKDDITVYREQ